VVGGLAGSSLTANIRVGIVARVAAFQLDTGLVAGTVIVTGTFSITSGIRISQEIWRTGTLGSMVDGVTVCVLTKTLDHKHLHIYILCGHRFE